MTRGRRGETNSMFFSFCVGGTIFSLIDVSRCDCILFKYLVNIYQCTYNVPRYLDFRQVLNVYKRDDDNDNDERKDLSDS